MMSNDCSDCENVCVCGSIEATMFSQQLDPLMGFADSKGLAEPCDSCNQQQLSISFIHHMDTELMLHAEYHITRGKLPSACACIRECVDSGERGCFSSTLATGRTFE